MQIIPSLGYGVMSSLQVDILTQGLWPHVCISRAHATSLSIFRFLLLSSFFLLARLGFPGGSVVKNPPANAGEVGDAGSIPGLGRSLGGGNGNPLQYSCLRNPMDRGAWQATWGCRESDTAE